MNEIVAASGFALSPHDWVPMSWTTAVKTGGVNCLVQTGTVISGSASLRIDGVTTGSSATFCSTKLPSYLYSDMFFHFKFRVSGIPAASSSELVVFEMEEGSLASPNGAFFRFNVTRNAGGTAPMIRFRIAPGIENVKMKELDIVANTTYSAQVRIYIPSVPGNNTYAPIYVEVKIDDVVQYATWGNKLFSTTSTEFPVINFGQQFTALETVPAVYAFVDDFVITVPVSGTEPEWPGNNLTTYDLVPDGAGTALGYTALGTDGATSEWTEIDEVVEANDLILAPRAALGAGAGDRESWSMSDFSGSGTVRGVGFSMTGFTSDITPGPGIQLIIYDGAEYIETAYVVQDNSQVSVGTAVGKRGRSWFYEEQPNSADTWDGTTLNNLECGIEIDSWDGSVAGRYRLWSFRAYVLTGDEGPAAGVPSNIRSMIPVGPFYTL